MSQFLDKLLETQDTTDTEIIAYKGVKFSVHALDYFQMQRMTRQAAATAEREMNETAPQEWKEQPGQTPGVSKWNEELEQLTNIHYTISQIAESLKQEDGSPVFTDAPGREKFMLWIRKEIPLWQTANEAIKKKFTALAKQASPKPETKPKRTASRKK